MGRHHSSSASLPTVCKAQLLVRLGTALHAFRFRLIRVATNSSRCPFPFFADMERAQFWSCMEPDGWLKVKHFYR